jgi:tRNA G18 (ribose-2'-O)-methylase SpoU
MAHYPYRDAINSMMDQGWNVRDDLKDHSLEELKKVQDRDTLPYAVCIVNVLGDLNVGMMLRSACCFGAEKFFIIGRRKFDRRSAVGAQNYMNIVRVDAINDLEIDSQKVMDTITEHGYTPLVFETGGRDFREMKRVWPELNKNDAKPCLVFGNEGYGLPEDLIQMVPTQHRFAIPQWGDAAVNVWESNYEENYSEDDL